MECCCHLRNVRDFLTERKHSFKSGSKSFPWNQSICLASWKNTTFQRRTIDLVRKCHLESSLDMHCLREKLLVALSWKFWTRQKSMLEDLTHKFWTPKSGQQFMFPILDGQLNCLDEIIAWCPEIPLTRNQPARGEELSGDLRGTFGRVSAKRRKGG